MKNPPRSDAAPGASSSQGSGEAASWRMGGRDVTGVETARARTGEKKSKFESTPTSMDLGMTARDGSEQALRPINHEPEQGLGQIEGFDCWDDAMLKEEIDYFYKRYHALPANDDYEAWAPISDHQLQDMELRFAICRIKAHKVPIIFEENIRHEFYFLHIHVHTDRSVYNLLLVLFLSDVEGRGPERCRTEKYVPSGHA